MKWITRRNLHIDRTACAWLVGKFIDHKPEFSFVSANTDPSSLDGHTFDMRGAEYSHTDTQCTFEVMIARHDLINNPALVEMGRIIRDADIPPRRTRRPEAVGVDAILRGLQRTVPDDAEKLRVTAPLYDALYAYCEAKVVAARPNQGTRRPRLSYRRRVNVHLESSQ